MHLHIAAFLALHCLSDALVWLPCFVAFTLVPDSDTTPIVLLLACIVARNLACIRQWAREYWRVRAGVTDTVALPAVVHYVISEVVLLQFGGITFDFLNDSLAGVPADIFIDRKLDVLLVFGAGLKYTTWIILVSLPWDHDSSVADPVLCTYE